MNKLLSWIIVMCSILLLVSGCSGDDGAANASEGTNAGDSSGVNVIDGSGAGDGADTDEGADEGFDADANPGADGGAGVSAEPSPGKDKKPNSSAGARADVDVDFSVFSSTIAQAEYNNIARKPSEYTGKKIRVIGSYYSLYLEQTGQHYHFVTIVYGDECCRQGFEIRLSGDRSSPSDYPAQNAIIEVIGTVDHYEELGLNFFFLATDEITLLNP